MRKTFALLAAAVLLSGAAQAQNRPQITNGDFETWTFDGANLPNYFNSFQTADGLFSGLAYDKNNRQVKRSTDKRPGSPGSYSCSIWSRKVSGVVAQGNLTTGRVHAAAMSATGKNNYNYSDRDGSNTSNGVKNPCAMPFTGRPDSLVVWVKFTPNGTDSSHPYAKVTATIHSDFDYIDGYAQTSDSKYVVATAVNMTIAKTNGKWKRLSIPFNYKNNGAQPKYILLSAATNAYPGGGHENDYLYLDDITLVYKQTYQLSIPSQGWATLCLDFNAKAPAGAKVYTVTELVAGYAKLQEIPAGSIIPANTGVLVRSDASSVTFESSIMDPMSVSGNLLKGRTTAGSCQAGQYYVLSPASTKERAVFGLYQGTSLAANKAYIEVR
jgi:hypothetical protein